MLSNQQTDATYQKARAALSNIIASPDTTEEQRSICQEKRADLTLAFIGRVIDDIEQRSARFREFIGEMEAVIAAFDSSTTIAGILQLKAVADEAAVLVTAATAAAPVLSARHAAGAIAEGRAVERARAPAKRSKRPKRRATPKVSRPGKAAKGRGKTAKRAPAPRKQTGKPAAKPKRRAAKVARRRRSS
jgi:hypothetical protein